MESPIGVQRTIEWWLGRLVLLGWFVIALVTDSADLRGSQLQSGHAPSAALALLMALPGALITLGVVVGGIWLPARYPVARGGIVRNLLRHVAIALGLGLGHVLMRTVLRIPFAAFAPALKPESDKTHFFIVSVAYLTIATLAHAVEYARRYEQTHTAELRLQADVGQAELERTAAELRMLKMQLNPQFLFNSLTTLSVLIPSAPAAAQRMVVGMAELFRRAMHSVATQEVAVDEELAGLVPFVEIEQERLSGGLVVEWQVADEALDALVPHMLLQPLVENAIQHGIVPAGGRGRICVNVARDGEWLTLVVTDDGAGLREATAVTPAAQAAAGIGLVNLQARLTQLYGTRHSLDLHAADGGGTRAVVRLPWHDEPVRQLPARAMRRADGDARATARLIPPPASVGLRCAELGVVLLWLGRRWRLGYVHRYEEALAHGSSASRELALIFSGLNAVIFAVALLAALRLTRARPISRMEWRRSLSTHALLAAAFYFALLGERMLGNLVIGYSRQEPSSDRPGSILVGSLIIYVIYAGLAHLIEYARRYRWKRAAELRLQVELGQAELARTSAELRMLKMQLNPHFLFNSLNAVILIIPNAPRVAQQMVLGLAELLRRAIHSVGTQEVTLDEEVAGLVPFVEIEQLRLGGGLTVAWQIAEEARGALVPHMLLQPLVENAIKHGIVAAGGRGHVQVEATREGDWLTLAVSDNGAGLALGSRAASKGNGVGSANIQARLAQLYGTRQTFELRAADGGGARAVVRLPWHEEPLDRPARPPVAATRTPSVAR